MTTLNPEPFYLVVTDHDQGFFSVEGPMTDMGPWDQTVGRAHGQDRHVTCGPTGSHRDELAASYRAAHLMFACVPPGSIVRPRT